MNNVVSVDIDELGPVLNRIKVDCDDIVEICKTAKTEDRVCPLVLRVPYLPLLQTRSLTSLTS